MRKGWLQSSGATRDIIFAALAHGFYEGCELIRKRQPDVLLIEPFPGNRDGIRWIKDLATEFPRIRILVVTSQSEQIYAERALHAGAAGYWMKNGSAEELIRALDTVAAGEVYISPSNRCAGYPEDLRIVRSFPAVSVALPIANW